MKKYKNIIIIFIVIILIVSTTLFLLLFRIEDQKNDEDFTISIASNPLSLIQKDIEFRTDKIVLEINFDNKKKQHKILQEEMIEKFDKDKLGKQEMKICYENRYFSFDVFLYNDDYLKQAYIYYYELNNQIKIDSAKNIYDIPVPCKNNQYFYGWYKDDDRQIKYSDGELHIVKLFPLFVDKETVKIDFYVDNMIYERKYFFIDDVIFYPNSPNLENCHFFGWNCEDLVATKDMDIHAITYKDGQCVVRFFSKDNKIIDYKIVSSNTKVENVPEAPQLEGNQFLCWNHDLNNVKENLDVYPIYKEDETKFSVRFYDASGNLLSEDLVNPGEKAEFNYTSDLYEVVDFSCDFSFVLSDLNVIVYLKPYIYRYYINSTLYKTTLSTDQIPPVPELRNSIGQWEAYEDKKNAFYAKYVALGQTFHFHTMEDEEVYTCDIEELGDLVYNLIIAKQKACYYEWYYDKDCLNPLHHSISVIVWDTVEVDLYGKLADFPHPYVPETSNLIRYKDGYLIQNSRSNIEMAWLTNENIVAIHEVLFDNMEIIILGDSISEIVDLDGWKESYCLKGIYVTENNPYFYSVDGNLYDKITDELLLKIGG